jgi:hypothetical protein
MLDSCGLQHLRYQRIARLSPNPWWMAIFSGIEFCESGKDGKQINAADCPNIRRILHLNSIVSRQFLSLGPKLVAVNYIHLL